MEARAELKKWRIESDVADKLDGVAGASLSVKVLHEIMDTNAMSFLLGGRMPKPKHAMDRLDERLSELDRDNEGLEGLLASLTSTDEPQTQH